MGQIYDITITNDKGETELIRWHPGEDKTEDELQAKRTELQADYDSKSYARARASVFPSITDVVVALAEKEEGDDTMWQEITAQRAKVKKDYPKPQN